MFGGVARLQIAQLVERGIVGNFLSKCESPQVAGSIPALENLCFGN